jgi:sulfite exporter TauE/SafE
VSLARPRTGTGFVDAKSGEALVDLLAVLATGLLAGGVSCAAVQGGLLAGLITRQRNNAPPPGLWRAQLADDLAPVGGFLAGKLVSHTIAGALLGLLGSAMRLAPAVQTGLQIAAGLLIITFGLAQLGVAGFRNIVIEPPLSWLRFVRNRARSQAALAPALLGVATVLIPCGVTLSVAALAMTTGSALAGAATMAVFVIGTMPLFAALGYLARRAATAWRGRLALLTGLVVLAMGLYTLNGGLERAGSPLAASQIAAALSPTEPAAATAAPPARGQQVVRVTARTGAYEPTRITAKAGVPTTLIVTSGRAQGCVRTLYLVELQIEKVLPITGETRIELGTLRPGQLHYTCHMGMYTGVITAA